MPLPQVMDQEIEGDGVPYAASIEEPSSSSHDSPPAVKSKSKRSKNKKAKTTAVIPEVTPQRKPIGTNHPTKPVTDADRRAGEGHWGTLLQGDIGCTSLELILAWWSEGEARSHWACPPSR